MVACPDALINDTDVDGLIDGRTMGEDINNNGVVDAGETDPCDPDTDNDGASDGDEVAASLDPLYWDTDADALPDGFEYDSGTFDGTTSTDGLADNDSDLIPNMHEYWE